MRKTIIYKTIKALCLVFAVCFLAVTQSMAQSEPDHYIPQSEVQKHDTFEQFNIQGIFDWLRAITTELVFIPEKSSDETVPTIRNGRIKGDRANIVTTDMSIRDGGKD